MNAVYGWTNYQWARAIYWFEIVFGWLPLANLEGLLIVKSRYINVTGMEPPTADIVAGICPGLNYAYLHKSLCDPMILNLLTRSAKA